MAQLKKQTVVAGAILVGGLAVAAVVLNQTAPIPVPEASPDAAIYFDTNAATDERIRALEIAVGEERNARQLLEEELRFILEELDRIDDGESEQVEEREARSRRDQNASDTADMREAFAQRRSERYSPEGRTQSLIDAGFSADRAALIVQREAELEMQAMQARYDIRQSGGRFDPNDTSLNPDATLRSELGDSAYEMYLEAYGRPTSVNVNGIMQASPAQSAGLQAGDRIVGYGGERVFSTGDLTAQTMNGTPGESVLVDIERDGAPMQIVLPRGPLGITSSRR